MDLLFNDLQDLINNNYYETNEIINDNFENNWDNSDLIGIINNYNKNNKKELHKELLEVMKNRNKLISYFDCNYEDNFDMAWDMGYDIKDYYLDLDIDYNNDHKDWSYNKRYIALYKNENGKYVYELNNPMY